MLYFSEIRIVISQLKSKGVFMTRLQIENFGPVKKCDIEITHLTVLVGNQGTGKSTIAKLYSSLVWLEKACRIQKVDMDKKVSKAAFSKLLNFQQISSYLQDETVIKYDGDFCRIEYVDNKLVFLLQDNTQSYVLPKIQYIPAERNLLSVVDKYGQMQYLSELMQNFIEIFDVAIQSEYVQKLKLPVNDLQVRYDKRSHKILVYNEDYSIPIGMAASGIQSLIPFVVVIHYFSERLFSDNKYWKSDSLDNKKLLDNLLLKELGYIPDNLEKDEKLKEIHKNIFNSCFIAVMEEPEQNLFPNSQKKVMQFLLQKLNTSMDNKIIVTTHSPYVLETINNCIYAKSLSDKNIKTDDLIPVNQQISYDQVSAYKIVNGCTESIKIEELKQLDPAEIDSCSIDINTVYSELSDREYADE